MANISGSAADTLVGMNVGSHGRAEGGGSSPSLFPFDPAEIDGQLIKTHCICS